MLQSSLWRHLSEENPKTERILALSLELRDKEMETEIKFNELAHEYSGSATVIMLYAQFLSEIKGDKATANMLEAQFEGEKLGDEAEQLVVQRRERAQRLQDGMEVWNRVSCFC